MITAELNPPYRKTCDGCNEDKQLTKITFEDREGSNTTRSIYICKSCMIEMVNKFDEVQEGLK